MIKFNNEQFIDAVDRHEHPKSNLAVFAGSSYPTLDKVLKGEVVEDNISIKTLHKLADYVGMDVEINIVPRVEAEKVAA
jgi:hypothetical protein